MFAGLTSLKILELSDVTLPRAPKSMLNLPQIEVVYFNCTGDEMDKDDYAALKKALGDKLKSDREGK